MNNRLARALLAAVIGSGVAAGQLSHAQQRLSDQMIAYWTRFAHTGDPNGHRAPTWPRFLANEQSVQSLAPGREGIRPVDLGREHRCTFWRLLDS